MLLEKKLTFFYQVGSGFSQGSKPFILIPDLDCSTECPRSLDPFNMVTYYIKWVTNGHTVYYIYHTEV